MLISLGRFPFAMAPEVLIIMGSKSDLPVGRKALDMLKELEVSCEIKVASAHRTPRLVQNLVEGTEAKVFIAIAGLAAALQVNLDSVLSIVQMPPGIPVAAVGLDRGENAALLAAEIIALSDPELAGRLEDHRKAQESKVRADSSSLQGE